MPTASEVVSAFVWIEHSDEGTDHVPEAGYGALADAAARSKPLFLVEAYKRHGIHNESLFVEFLRHVAAALRAADGSVEAIRLADLRRQMPSTLDKRQRPLDWRTRGKQMTGLSVSVVIGAIIPADGRRLLLRSLGELLRARV